MYHSSLEDYLNGETIEMNEYKQWSVNIFSIPSFTLVIQLSLIICIKGSAVNKNMNHYRFFPVLQVFILL